MPGMVSGPIDCRFFRRQKSLMWNGCNYVGKKTKRSCPFAIFSRQDLLTLALEMGRRSGTENVPGIIGTAVALMLADGLMLHNAQKVRHLRDRIIDELSSMDGVLVTGPDPGPMRLPGLASFIIDGVDSETLVMDLSAKGVCVSAGSACSSGTGKPSYVLRAMGYSEREAWSSLRVSLDDHITHDEVSELIQAIKSSIKVIRNQH